MALEEILQSMEEQAEQAKKQILAEAQSQAARIVAEGKRRAEDIYASESEHILAPLKAESTRIVNEARLELQHSLQERKESLWNETLDRARTQLGGIRSSGDYPKIFSSLASEAMEQMAGDLILEVSPEDREVAEEAASQASGRQVTVETAPGNLGGLTAYSPSTQVRAINTLDSRLERVTSSQISDLASKLFATAADKAEG